MARILDLSSINLASLSQKLARLDHYYQARFRNRFAPTVRALSRFIPAGAHILDIGANHGKFAKHFARLHAGSCTVWCFEPLPYNYTLLQQIVGGFPNVRVHKVALSDKAGTAEFYVPLRPSRRISPGAGHLGDETHK
ncbi:MAG TPA: FkbM family methyltransferase, partial [Phycisphaerales bacterium]|nr:FkbM family methyltransferase [Phycisphaerales bacterium]